MKKYIVFAVLFLMFLPLQIYAASKAAAKRVKTTNVVYPHVPRASAFEAYTKYKAGKAIIIQAGGSDFNGRHIMGALDLREEDVRKGKLKLPNFPKKGIEIFTYCY
jgi:hypothetical protein